MTTSWIFKSPENKAIADAAIGGREVKYRVYNLNELAKAMGGVDKDKLLQIENIIVDTIGGHSVSNTLGVSNESFLEFINSISIMDDNTFYYGINETSFLAAMIAEHAEPCPTCKMT